MDHYELVRLMILMYMFISSNSPGMYRTVLEFYLVFVLDAYVTVLEVGQTAIILYMSCWYILVDMIIYKGDSYRPVSIIELVHY